MKKNFNFFAIMEKFAVIGDKSRYYSGCKISPGFNKYIL